MEDRAAASMMVQSPVKMGRRIGVRRIGAGAGQAWRL
jgi:hypothetical protein